MCRNFNPPADFFPGFPIFLKILPVYSSRCLFKATVSNLSDSKPSPGKGAGRVTAPLLRAPKRMIVQLPCGASQFNVPSGCNLSVRSRILFFEMIAPAGTSSASKKEGRKGFTPGTDEYGAR